MNDDVFIPAASADDGQALQDAVDACRVASLRLTLTMLGGVGEVGLRMIENHLEAGWSLGTECVSDKHHQPTLRLVLVNMDGQERGGRRRIVADVAEGAPRGSH